MWKQSNLLFLFLMAMHFQGCSGPSTSKVYKKGMCIEEINNRYVASESTIKVYYRVDAVHSDSYSISQYSNKMWVPIKDRPHHYFEGTKNFSFVASNCPDTDSASMSDKIKSIGIR